MSARAPQPAFLAISTSPDRIHPIERTAILERAGRAVAALYGDEAISRVEGGDQTLLWIGSSSGFYHDPGSGALCGLLGHGSFDIVARRALTPEGLLRQIAAGGVRVFEQVAPPFAGVMRLSRCGRVQAATDLWGLHHLYWWQGEGWAAAASSCLLLGSVAGQSIAADNVAAYGLLGFYLEDDTPIENVYKLQPGHACTLERGRVSSATYRTHEFSGDDCFLDIKAARDTGMEALRDSVLSAHEAFPQCSLSLSGGLDSRLLVAALPPSARASVRAVTIRAPGSQDALIAERVARVAGMPLDIVDISEMDSIGPSETFELAKRASIHRDNCANPLTAAVLEWVESGIEQLPRLNGQNGEFGRGFYYAGQRMSGGTTPERVMRLARWRLLVGEGADTRLLAEPYRSEATASVIERTQEIFDRYRCSWPEAMDEFYLAGRMQRWVGVEVSRTAALRVDLSPFFDSRFITWARRVAPSQKRNSVALCQLLAALDPQLAKLPLEHGPSPNWTLRRGFQGRIGHLNTFTRRAAAKLAQRISRRSRAPSGTILIRRKVIEALARNPEALSRAAASGLFESASLERLGSGELQPSIASLGLMLNVEWILECLDALDQ